MKKITLFTILLSFCFHSYSQIGFQNHVIIEEGFNSNENPSSIYGVDIDGDGDNDIVATIAGLGEVVWYENIDGRAFLTKKVISNNADGIKDIYASDIDGDGDIDVVSCAGGGNKLTWYENTDGQGTFNEQLIATNVYFSKSVYVGDADGDGDMDIFLASLNRISWFENIDGQGTFSNIITISTDADDARYVYAADMDNDNDIDVLSASEDDDKIAWYENIDGQGTFSSERVISTNANGAIIAFAEDLDNDGDMDVVSTSLLDDKLAWYENDGQGNFGVEQIISTTDPENIQSIHSGDLDNDGDMDIIFASNTDNDIGWFENIDGQGTFGPKQLIDGGLSRANFVFAIDIDNDADTDIIGVSDEIDVIVCYTNTNGTANFEKQINIEARADQLESIYLADLDNDGDEDMISNADTAVWYENVDGQGTFSSQQIIPNNYPKDVFAADIDNDGDKDIITSSWITDEVVWNENIDGQGTFGPSQIIFENFTFVTSIFVEDIDNDGDNDVLAADSVGNSIYWFENTDGQGTFGNQQLVSSLQRASFVSANDIDNDGDMDIISFSNASPDSIVWYENLDGLGAFGTVQIIADNLDVRTIFVGDIDNDSDEDIVSIVASSNPNSYNIVWYENTDGQGAFSTGQTIVTLQQELRSVHLSDVDHDGDMDILSSYASEGKLVWYENDGQNIFSQEQLITDENDIESGIIATSDVNNDGKIDIISGSTFNDRIVWIENLGLLGNRISGKVKLDMDLDGCTSSDSNLPNLLIIAKDGANSFATYSQNNGYFRIPVDAGDFTTIATAALSPYFTATPISHASSFVGIGNIDTVDFCIQPIATINDVNISVYPSIDEPRPGFNTTYRIVYKNIGTTLLSGDVTFEYDNTKLQFLNASETVNSQTTNTLTFNYSNLNPFETKTIDLEFNVFAPPTTNIDDILSTTATINPISGDNTADDNVFTLQQTVIGSYDPNDIQVLEGDQILLEETDKYLHYIIRFQNTGTASAINVNVENVLDSNLDWTTMQLESLSHNGRVEIRDGNMIKFIFNNINLPDSTSDEPNSHGFITYKIKPKSTVALGDIMYNTADIFFDFNPPITTNTVSTEIVEPLSIEEFVNNKFSIYPNPTKDIIHVKGREKIKKLSIIDLNGRLLNEINYAGSQTTAQISISDYEVGLYFLSIETEKGIYTHKIIKK